MNRLKELRKQKGLTQIAFAKIFNAGQSTVANWENGTREPDNEKLKEISNFFDVSVDYLLENTDIRKIPEELENVKVAFHGGAFDGLDEDDIDFLRQTAIMLKKKKETNREK